MTKTEGKTASAAVKDILLSNPDGLPIPMKPPLCSEMIAPPVSGMISPPV
ncbi:hypothetical protein I7I49_08540 [Sinorhizobium meliloti]|nr:hypothetical protein [Sinorhizobium meliloti]MDE3810328.1 hypothetical protein [Sinorhizobium meliloti]